MNLSNYNYFCIDRGLNNFLESLGFTISLIDYKLFTECSFLDNESWIFYFIWLKSSIFFSILLHLILLNTKVIFYLFFFLYSVLIFLSVFFICWWYMELNFNNIRKLYFFLFSIDFSILDRYGIVDANFYLCNLNNLIL